MRYVHSPYANKQFCMFSTHNLLDLLLFKLCLNQIESFNNFLLPCSTSLSNEFDGEF